MGGVRGGVVRKSAFARHPATHLPRVGGGGWEMVLLALAGIRGMVTERPPATWPLPTVMTAPGSPVVAAVAACRRRPCWPP